MADTQRTKAALQTLLADNAAAHSTNRQLIRDVLVSLVSVFGDTLSGDLVIQGITAGRGNLGIHGNTAFGFNALSQVTVDGVANTAFGLSALAQCRDAPGNVAIGYGAMGGVVTGNGANTAVGYQCSALTTSGTQNAAVGYWALRSTTTGSNNAALGYRAGMSMVSGNYNVMVGYATLDAPCGDQNTAIGGFAASLNTGSNNCIGGYFSFVANTSGVQNTTWGTSSLKNNVVGDKNVALGYFAGAYELGSNAFYVDNQDRTNTAGDKAKAMFYGVFNAAPASQTLAINAVTTISQSLVVTGGITAAITGNVTGNLTGTILTASQPNITSLGTIAGLTTSGVLTANGSISLAGVAQEIAVAGRIRFSGLYNAGNANGTIYQHTTHGILAICTPGGTNDFLLAAATSFATIFRVPTGTVNTVFGGTMTVAGAFGCNTKAAQTAFSLGAASTDLATVIALANNLRTMAINNGMGS